MFTKGRPTPRGPRGHVAYPGSSYPEGALKPRCLPRVVLHRLCRIRIHTVPMSSAEHPACLTRGVSLDPFLSCHTFCIMFLHFWVHRRLVVRPFTRIPQNTIENAWREHKGSSRAPTKTWEGCTILGTGWGESSRKGQIPVRGARFPLRWFGRSR